MNRIDRLTAILIHLQTKKVVKAQEIADRFGISLRTVYRDIRALEEAGVPIGAEAGIGYFLMEGYHLPPVMFNKEEAGALLTGEKLMEKLGDKSVGKHYAEAMRKIRAVLRVKEKEYIEALENTLFVHQFEPQNQEQFPNHFLSTIQQGLAERQVVAIEYFSYAKDEVSQRHVEPVGICYRSHNWHLIAWCRLRADYRDFRIDRIKSLRLLEETFRKREDVFFRDYVDKILKPKTLHKLVVTFDQSVARYMYEQKFYYGLVEEVTEGDKVRMTFLSPSLCYFGRWLLLWGNTAEVVEPEALKEHMGQLAKEVFLHYQQYLPVLETS